ncbi:Protein RRP5 -like protein [Trichinella sp. T9]|nr:Protein RRP5 -like protein [Trichinella sp. T9]
MGKTSVEAMFVLLLIIVWCNSFTVSSTTIPSLTPVDEQRGFNRREHSLSKPYQNTGFNIPFWNFGGSTIVTSDYVRLTPDSPSRQGFLWNTIPVVVRDWELEVTFSVHGVEKGLFGDGMAIWYAEEPGVLGPVFGSKDMFRGLAVFLDTYTNHQDAHNHAHPYISAMVNNGSLRYDHDRDGTHTQLGGHDSGCTAKFRNKEFPTRILIRYVGDTLSVYTDILGKAVWDLCFAVDRVSLPKRYFFGMTAATGDLSDAHDIISVRMFEIEYQRVERAGYDTRGAVPQAEYISAPRDHVEDNPPPSKLSTLKYGFLFILGLIGIGILVVAASGKTMIEVAFPRGGEHRDQINFKKRKSLLPPDLHGRRKKFKTLDKLKSKEASVPENNHKVDDDFASRVWTKKLNNETCVAGLLTVACVHYCWDTEVNVEMPGNMNGILKAGSVSQSFVDHVQAKREDEEAATLASLFEPAELICVKVIDKEMRQFASGKMHTTWLVTTNPADLNAHITPSTLRKHAVIGCAVRSVEEKGYLMDLGFQNVHGFLSFAEACRFYPENKQLQIGKPILCTVVEPAAATGGRVVQLSCLNSQLNGTDVPKIDENFPKSLLMPGLLCRTTVQQHCQQGLICKLNSDLYGWLSLADSPKRRKRALANEQSLQGSVELMVTYSLPQSSMVGFSSADYLLRRTRLVERFSFDAKGSLQTCKVRRSTPEKVQFITDSGAIVNVANCRLKKPVGKKKNSTEKYKLATKHRVRMIGMSTLKMVYHGSCLVCDVRQPFSKIDEAAVGLRVTAKVVRVSDTAALVKVFHTFDGKIDALHFSDGLVSVGCRAKFVVGQTVPTRVLAVDKDLQRLYLTAKRSLVKSDLPLLSDYTAEAVGNVYDGFVVQLLERGGVLIGFYNNVRGVLDERAFQLAGYQKQSPTDVYHVGQVVRVLVVRVDVDKRRIDLALPECSARGLQWMLGCSGKVSNSKLEADVGQCARAGGSKRKPPPFFELLKAEVKALRDDWLLVELVEYGVSARLPSAHLTDSLTTGHLLLASFRVGDKLDVVLFNNVKGLVVTAKPSLLHLMRNMQAPRSLDDLKCGQLVTGVLARVHPEHGYFIDLPGNMSALCPKSKVEWKCETDAGIANLIGATVVGRVMTVNSQAGKLIINLKLKKCLLNGLHTSIALLKQYLEERELLSQRFRNPSNTDWKRRLLSKYQIGQLVECTVGMVVESGLICTVEDGVPGIFVSELLDPHWNVEYAVGSSLIGLVVCVNYSERCLELAAMKRLLSNFRQVALRRRRRQPAVGDSLTATVLVANADCVLLSTAGHGLCYMPARLHYNDLSLLRFKNTDKRQLRVHVQAYTTSGQCLVSSVRDEQFCSKIERRLRSTVSVQPSNESGTAPVIEEKGVAMAVGRLYSASVLSVDKRYVHLFIAGRYRGRIFATELDEQFLQDGSEPLKTVRLGTTVTVKVIGTKRIRKGGSLMAECTMKSSKLFSKRNKKTIIGYKENFVVGEELNVLVVERKRHHFNVVVNPRWSGEVSFYTVDPRSAWCNGQLRKVYVLDVDVEKRWLKLSALKPAMVELKENGYAFGKLLSRDDKDLLTKLSFSMLGGARGVASLVDICDNYDHAVDKWRLLQVESYYKLFVVGKLENNFWHVSLRPSLIGENSFEANNATIRDDPLYSLASELAVGNVYRGFVSKVRHYKKGLTVLLGHELFGNVPYGLISECTDAVRLDQTFPIGTVVTVKVMNLDKSNGNLTLSMLSKDTGLPDQVPEKCRKLLQSDDSISSQAQLVLNKAEESPAALPLRACSWFESAASKRKKSSDKKKVPLSEIEGEIAFDLESTTFSAKTLIDVSLNADNVSDGTLMVNGKHGAFIANGNQCSSAASGENDYELEVAEREGKSKLELDRLDEEEVLKKELMLMDPERPIETVEDYDRALVASPSSSMLWIRYMAYFVQCNEIDKARSVASKALKTIAYNEEKERFNVWIALMNLENEYGTGETMDETVRNALLVNDQQQVYLQLLKIYDRSKKLDAADAVTEVLLKKYRPQFDVWITVGKHFMQTNRAEKAHAIMERAMKSLPFNMHVDLMSRFAQMEFKFEGDVERGCTIFENILNDHPRRFDIWLVYVDLMAKHRNIDEARPLLRRVTSLKMSAHKMRNFFKKWLELENRYGTAETVADVKSRATDYVNNVFSDFDELKQDYQ